ncbi:MAG TPA: MgtC/SapB family protein [Gemmatimonadaceae bacterium]|jgi:putative Mg2+ transporter-C (MgtC) family protein
MAEHDWVLMLRVVIAAVLSGALGWERQVAGKTAGLRTHVLVGIGSSLFVVLGEAVAQGYPADPAVLRIEPLALIQAVAVGIGFLGSGVVVVLASGSVKGLTTAASIWATAAVGVATGFGHFILAVGTTVLLLVALRGLRLIEKEHDQT